DGSSTVDLASLEGSAAGPTIVYPLHGKDTIDASGLTAPVWFVSGTGADRMTGGKGANTYIYTSPDDSGHSGGADTITNFKATSDKFDFSDISTLTAVQGVLDSSRTKINAHSIAWLISGGNTLLYANDTDRPVSQGSADMQIVLNGANIGLTADNFI